MPSGSPPQRQGGQAQFIKDSVPEHRAETLDPLLTWIVGHLDEPLDVDALARRAAMSPRTFAHHLLVRCDWEVSSSGRKAQRLPPDEGIAPTGATAAGCRTPWAAA